MKRSWKRTACLLGGVALLVRHGWHQSQSQTATQAAMQPTPSLGAVAAHPQWPKAAIDDVKTPQAIIAAGTSIPARLLQ